jgi:predicted ATP-binding protein involved in virulence
MKIKQLNIEGFRGIVNKKITFPDDNVAILIGKNGSGKSSVLDLVSRHLILLIDNSLKAEKAYTIKELKTAFVARSLDFDQKDFQKNSNNILSNLKVDDSGDEKQHKILVNIDQTTNHEGEGNSVVTLKAIRNLSVGSDINIPIFTNHYFSNKEFSKKRAHDSGKYIKTKQVYAFRGSFLEEKISFENFKLWFEEEENIENEQKVAKKNFDWTNQKLEVVRNAIEIFLGFLPDSKFEKLRIKRSSEEADSTFFRHSQIKKHFIITKNGDDLLVDQLSDGEKKLLMLVTDLARRLTIANPSRENPLEGEGIVLIDEVELHLHPQWQRIVVPALSGTFPNIQFIISSHSPFVAQSVGLDNLLVLDSDPNQIEVKPSADDSEHSYQSIIKEVFGIDSFFSVEVENDLEQFRNFRTKIFQGDEYDKSVFDKLVEKLTGYGYEIEAIIARELRQIERLTKEKTV